MVYQWKASAQLSKLDPQKCGTRLEQIEKKKGALTPETVVDDARSKSSPLHKGFTWDDSEAAEAHRLNEARYLLRQIVVVTSVPDKDEEPKTIRAFVSVQQEDGDEDDNNGKTYVNVTDALSDPKMREQVLTRAYNELKAWQARYEGLEEFAGVRKAIANVKLKNAKASAR